MNDARCPMCGLKPTTAEALERHIQHGTHMHLNASLFHNPRTFGDQIRDILDDAIRVHRETATPGVFVIPPGNAGHPGDRVVFGYDAGGRDPVIVMAPITYSALVASGQRFEDWLGMARGTVHR